jgi:hypothetical protein
MGRYVWFPRQVSARGALWDKRRIVTVGIKETR